MPRLADLNPEFLGHGGPGIFHTSNTGDIEPVPRREGIGIAFDCPCGCELRCYVPFANPLDGGPQVDVKGWHREGDTFDTLTLAPSILRVGGCGWHGWLRNGELISV